MAEKVSQKQASFIPLLGQLRSGTKNSFRHDLTAAVTVTVMLVPQAMAYAMLAGLSPVVGLYASTIPLIIYALLGTSHYLAVGPVAMISLLVYDGISPLAEPGTLPYHKLAITLALMVGVIQIMLGLFRAGFMVNYISKAVIAGFTSAAALIISISQLKHLTGCPIPNSGSIFTQLAAFAGLLQNIHFPTICLGFIATVFLLLMRRFFPGFPGSISVVIVSTTVAYLFKFDLLGMELVGSVPSGFPQFQLPSIHINTLKALFPVALAITFIGYMESYAIAQSFATRRRQEIDPDREFTALGASNIAAGLASGYPVTGGLSRTAVNFSAGASTGLSGLFTAGMMILTLLFLTPVFTYLPRAILASIIVSAAISLFEFREFLHLIQVKVGDGLSFLATFLITLIAGVETGIFCGVILSLSLFIRRSATPHMAELGYCKERDTYLNIARFPMTQRYPKVLIIRIDASLYFANTGVVSNQTRKWIDNHDNIGLVIFDCEGVNDIDAVAIGMLENLIKDYDARLVDFAFARLKGPVRDILTRAGWHHKYPHSIRFRSIRQVIHELKISAEAGYLRDKTPSDPPDGVDKTR